MDHLNETERQRFRLLEAIHDATKGDTQTHVDYFEIEKALGYPVSVLAESMAKVRY
jgi:hypothetical protein